MVRENGTPSQQPVGAAGDPDRDSDGSTAREEGATAPATPPQGTASAAAQGGADRGGAKQPRKLKTVRDMLLSMAVITVGALFFYVVQPTDTGQDPVRAVDYAVEASTASRAAPYELVVPEDLDEGWRATSVRYRQSSDHGALWRIGFMDPDNEYVALGQADGPARAFVHDFSQGAQDTGETVTVDGREWAVHAGSKYDALVSEEGDVTTVVTGTAGAAQLEAFAAALAPHPNQ
ncbi:DUF4245 domain-containing protein [Streptomyces bohaiensis]